VLAVNIIGSFILGCLHAIETTNLMDSRQFYTVALNIILNVGLSIGAVYGGRIIGSTIYTLQFGR
jgi:fluoride exporter